MISLKIVTEDIELQRIQQLQLENHRSVLDESTRSAQGFVTALYSLDVLMDMHKTTPGVIACDGDSLCGYVLAADRNLEGRHPILDSLYQEANKSRYKETLLDSIPYLVVGQVCIAQQYRGKGLFSALYEYYREYYQKTYPCCLTDIDLSNVRSLRAHLNLGFETVSTFRTDQSQWQVVLWDWGIKPSGDQG